MSIEKLPTNASLKEVMNKFEEISLQDLADINIITASELPSDGKDGQLCILTEHEPGNIYVGSKKTTLNEKDIFVQLGLDDISKGVNICSSNKMINLRISQVTQVQNGEDIVVLSYVRESGKWIELPVFIFKEGIGDVTEYTGGYSTTVPTTNSGNRIMFSDSHIYINAYSSQSQYATTYMASKNAIDLTNFSKIAIDFRSTGKIVDNNSYDFSLAFGVNSKTSSTYAASKVYSKSTGLPEGRNVIELDVSKLSGTYYFRIGASGYAHTTTAYIYNIALLP